MQEIGYCRRNHSTSIDNSDACALLENLNNRKHFNKRFRKLNSKDKDKVAMIKDLVQWQSMRKNYQKLNLRKVLIMHVKHCTHDNFYTLYHKHNVLLLLC